MPLWNTPSWNSSTSNEPAGDAAGSAQSTRVIDGTQVKILVWYDNEWGYACRLVDLAQLVGHG